MVSIIERYITKSGTTYDHVNGYSDPKNPEILVRTRKDKKCFKITQWAYLSDKLLEHYNHNKALSEDVLKKLLNEQKGKESYKKGGRIVFINLKGKPVLTSVVEHIKVPPNDAGLNLEDLSDSDVLK